MNIKVKTKLKDKTSAEDIFQAILKSRGYKTKSQQAEFLHPQAPTLEFLLKESGLKKSTLAKASKILDTHLQKNHDICIFGDYDADGVTSTAIMWQAVVAYAKKSGSSSRILPFIPDRHKHGYGLGDKAVAEVISGTAFTTTKHRVFIPALVITVDTGIVAHAGINSFQAAGISVIITDHHLPDPELPPADAIVHTTTTSGAGVAWIFSLHLLGSSAQALLDLATIGVVGDMMPLSGLNRSIVAHGLVSLTSTTRPGIMALKTAMGIESKEITTYDISFGIAPRINAAGRIYNPLDALRLLCTTSLVQAKELAQVIESHNRDRQEYTDRALKIAASKNTSHKIIVLCGDYHEGVIGLVAGKLVELFHRPAVVMSQNGEVIKGSARSVPGVNITGLLRSLKTPFLGLGGHEQAAGFSLAHESLESMQEELETLADKTISPEILVKSHSADLALSLGATSKSLAKLISTLEPFGLGNPKPKFLLEALTVLDDRQLGSDGQHRKLTLESGGTTRELMLFSSKEPYPLKEIKALICTLDINTWRDKETLQLIGSYVEI